MSVVRALYARVGKRALDLAIGVPALVVAAPVIAASIAVVRASSIGAPAIFKQERAGKGGKAFAVYKLRTMTNERDASGALLPDEQRLTALGELLRKSSIDELPQLWNVVRGDMSLVGPRPLYVRYIDRYDDEQRKRLDVRPGVTGWSQVNGRNALDWDSKLALDAWYAQHVSPLLDLRILAKTAIIVLRRDGYAPEGQVRIPEFMGRT
jgi:sugar transferase EpsL